MTAKPGLKAWLAAGVEDENAVEHQSPEGIRKDLHALGIETEWASTLARRLSPPPKVSIGLPVFNGERYLRRAIESHLSQTFTDFELIICDNGSTDATEAICQEYTQKDHRMRYFRSAENMGAMWNFNRAFNLARGEYFKWSACDDVIGPTYLERCVAILDARPDVTLCHSLSKVVDLATLNYGDVPIDRLEVLATYDPGAIGTDVDGASARFGARVNARRCLEIFGLMRRTELAKVNRAGRAAGPDDDPCAGAPFQTFVGASRPVLAELAIAGRFACVPEYLFYNGEHPARITSFGHDPLKRLAFYCPVVEGTRSFPIWSLFSGYLDVISRRFPDRHERFACYGHMFTALFTRFNLLRMALEAISAAMPETGITIARAITEVRRWLGRTGFRRVPENAR